MKILAVKKDYLVEASRLRGKLPDRSHVDFTLDADTKVIAPDGSITAVLICEAIPAALHKRAYELWKPINGLPSNRPTALGTKRLARSVSKSGVASPRTGVNAYVLKHLPARTGILGFRDLTCPRTALTLRHPEMIIGNRELTERIDAIYGKYMPHLYARQRSEIERADSRWRLWTTVFSTIYLAKNWQTGYHTDGGNMPGVMSALTPTGRFTGGELVLPRWRVAIAFRPGDLLLFDPQQVHGNLPISGERISAAFYCGGDISRCGE